jgi:hypothetical protein
MKGLTVPTVLQSEPKAPAVQMHLAGESGPCVQNPWPLHVSNAHAASHEVALAADVCVVAGQESPEPSGATVTLRLRVYCRGARAGAAEVAGTGLPQGPTTQLRDDCEMTMAPVSAWGCPDIVKAPGMTTEINSGPAVRRYEGTGGSVMVTEAGPV